MRLRFSPLVLAALFWSLPAAQAETPMSGVISVPKTIQGVSANLACHDVSISLLDVPNCPAGQLCKPGPEFKSSDAHGTYSSGKCNYSLDVPDNKKFDVSIGPSSHMPKCSVSGDTLRMGASKGPTGPFDLSGVPDGVSLLANYTVEASCQKPPS